MIVCVLGCGPAGLLAASAVEEMGHSVMILSKKTKSPIRGAMFLHRSIPGVTSAEPELLIDVIKSGTREGYAKLVYGDPEHPVSWDKFSEGTFPAWNLAAAYDKLWERFESKIQNIEITPENIGSVLNNFERVYSTISANSLCADTSHDFRYQRIWIKHGDGSGHLIPRVNDWDIMYYNGYPPDGSVGDTVGPDWYRFSQINRYQSWEYSCHPRGIGDYSEDSPFEVSEGIKPISTSCDCLQHVPNPLHRIGRFGRWEKQVLTHHAYDQVLADMKEYARAL